jgi:hypothetical protein
VHPDAVTVPPASAAAPVLVLYDAGPIVADNHLTRSPWLTAVHLVLRLTPALSTLLDASDLVLVPRPAPDEAEATLELLRLPPTIATQFERMTPNEVLAVTRQRALFVTIAPTAAEAALLAGR